MKPDTIKRLDALFERFPTMRAEEVPSEAEIADAEKELGVPFPADYREFLLRYGGGLAGPYPVYGLRPVEDLDPFWSVVEITRRFREDDIPAAKEWVVVSEDHAGNPIGIDRDGAVWTWDHDFEGLAPVAKDFEKWLRKWNLKRFNLDQAP